MRKIPFAGIELTSQRVRGLRGTSELPGRPANVLCFGKSAVDSAGQWESHQLGSLMYRYYKILETAFIFHFDNISCIYVHYSLDCLNSYENEFVYICSKCVIIDISPKSY